MPTEAETLRELRRLLSDTAAAVDAAWVDDMLAQYPYFVLPLLLYLQRTPAAADRDDRLARLAIASPDRQALAMLLGEDTERFAHFYPAEQQPVTPDTDTTIDRFLNSYGNTSQREIEALENAIFHPTPDYADVLAADERDHPTTPAATDEQDELISRFIEQSRQQAQLTPTGPERRHVDEQEKQEIATDQVGAAEQHADDKMLTESLAKLYITQHKYAQALEIIEKICLNFPEKSIYFADQIRFLRKLVWIENKQNTNNNK